MKGIYAILDENNYNFDDLDNIVFKMINKNIKIFQIRIKSNFSNSHIKIIKKVKKICDTHKSTLVLNDNINITRELNLDGLHIGSKDIDIASARSFLGKKKIIGVSCYNNIKLSLSAEKNSASYVSFGSLYNTSTKSNASNLNEITFVSAKKVLSIPICLIGGINSDNIHYVIKLNSDLIAISKGLSSNDKLEYISNAYYE